MVLKGKLRRIIVRGQEFRWFVSSSYYICSCNQCRELSLVIEKRLRPLPRKKPRKSSSADPSKRKSICLTLALGTQLPYLPSCPSLEDLEEYMLPRRSQQLTGFVRLPLPPLPSLQQLAIDAILDAHSSLAVLPHDARLPEVSRSALCSSVFPLDPLTGLPDLSQFAWDKQRRPKDPSLLAFPRSPRFAQLLGQRLTLVRLALAHSEWCYANQVTPSQVAGFIEQTLDKGYWQDDSPSLKLQLESEPHDNTSRLIYADPQRTLSFLSSEIDFSSLNHINSPDLPCPCQVTPKEAELFEIG